MRCDKIFCFELKCVQKVFKINLQLNIYPHNTFYNNLGVYSVIIHIAYSFMMLLSLKIVFLFPQYFF